MPETRWTMGSSAFTGEPEGEIRLAEKKARDIPINEKRLQMEGKGYFRVQSMTEIPGKVQDTTAFPRANGRRSQEKTSRSRGDVYRIKEKPSLYGGKNNEYSGETAKRMGDLILPRSRQL